MVYLKRGARPLVSNIIHAGNCTVVVLVCVSSYANIVGRQEGHRDETGDGVDNRRIRRDMVGRSSSGLLLSPVV